LKLLAVLGLLVLALSALAVPIGRVGAAGTGLYKNVPPWWTERLKAMNQGNSTDDFVGQYSNPSMPSYSEQARLSNPSSSILIQILAAVLIVLFAAFAVYLYGTDKSPEQALEESAKLRTKR
jgi:hypothetical protein